MDISLRIHIPTREDLTAYKTRLFSNLNKQYLLLEDKLFYTSGQRIWKLYYKLTGRCGSQLNSHIPVYGNHHRWLWKKRGLTHSCTICGKKIKESKQIKHISSYSNRGRESDVTELNKLYKQAKSETARKAIAKSLYNINHEDKRVKAMREDLIKATREQDHTTIKNIHEYVGEKKGLQQSER